MEAAEQKRLLRREMRARLAALGPASRTEISRRIVQNIISSSVWRQARSVLLFSPLASEPDISGLFDKALTDKKIIHFPKVNGNDLTVFQVTGKTDLYTGSFGILEPRETATVVSSDTIQLALVPGLAFDANGHRLGRGKGYYDRFLATTKASTMGVFFSCQYTPLVPIEGHDVRLDLVVTE